MVLAWLIPVSASAQTPPAGERFLNVTSWSGTFSMNSPTTTWQTTTTSPYSRDPAKYTFSFQSSSRGTFRLDTRLGPYEGNGWRGVVTGSLTVNHVITVEQGSCVSTWKAQGTFPVGVDPILGEPVTLTLTVKPTTNTYDLLAGNLVGPGTAGFDAPIEIDYTSACKNAPVFHKVSKGSEQWFPRNEPRNNPLPASGLGLARTTSIPGQVPLGYGILFPELEKIYQRSVTWDLKPDQEELELIIEPQGYETWRPEATRSESQAGNSIAVKAWLRRTDGSPVAPDTKAQFVFDLVNVSHEPGVALNSPLQDPAASADLQFVPGENPRLTVSGAENLHAETPPGEAATDATAVVSSFDWGAWGEIQVTAKVPGRDPIKGYLKGDKAQTSVRLPKRQASSKIADAWKQQNGINKPDQDDSEPEPAGLPGCDGDGLTLYEEYRGFYENGRHIEGNPQKKDFFILNMVGADAEPGIWVFADVTGLEVHKDLTEAEFNYADRVVNKNYAQAPHRVDQHGVFLVQVAVNGAEAHFTEVTVNARPYLTTGIMVQARDDTRRLLGQQKHLSSLDAAQIYDKAIAHELLHTVGVEHHGWGDTRLDVKLVLADDAQNTTGAAYFREQIDGPRVQILDESTGQDYVTVFLEKIIQVAQKQIASGEAVPQAYRFLVDIQRGTVFQEGVKNGQHSGNEQCVMRYSFADIYPAEGQANVYYKVPDGSEPSGLQLCDSPAGTGVNAPRNPQPRYFGAAEKRGNCKAWVCVNDAIPPGSPFP